LIEVAASRRDQAGEFLIDAHQQAKLSALIVSSWFEPLALNVARPDPVQFRKNVWHSLRSTSKFGKSCASLIRLVENSPDKVETNSAFGTCQRR
jgi:hypothetical protein